MPEPYCLRRPWPTLAELRSGDGPLPVVSFRVSCRETCVMSYRNYRVVVRPGRGSSQPCLYLYRAAPIWKGLLDTPGEFESRLRRPADQQEAYILPPNGSNALPRSVPPGGVPPCGPHGEDPARIQPGGHVPDIGQDACGLRRTGRPENIQRRASRLNPDSLRPSTDHDAPPICLALQASTPQGGDISTDARPYIKQTPMSESWFTAR
jgi:hypothetical protein